MPSVGGDPARQAAAGRKVSAGNQLGMLPSQPLFAVAQPGVMSEINGRGGWRLDITTMMSVFNRLS
jgi:hypothetical protein